METLEFYFEPEFYNPRVRATIPGFWVVILSNGSKQPVCQEWEANNAQEARAVWEAKQ